MIGQTLGHYKIVAKIGAGGMGEVYRAHDKQLERDVALKVLPAGTIADEAARKQFRKEALALAKLNHPNIETVHEFSSQDGMDFLVMELIQGHSLSQKLQEGPLLEREIVRLGIQFADGLAAAHKQSVVHRDLKPGNLMVTPEGRLKILDFGLARLTQVSADPDITRSITQETGTISGTVPYMAPEQLRGEQVDARADLYAAGAVLYEMATGKRAFSERQPLRLYDSILHEVPPSPRAKNPRISPGLEALIQRAMEKEPASRYQTAREMLAVLEGLSVGKSPSLASKGPYWSLAATGGGILLIVLLLGLAFGLDLGGLRDRLLGRGSAEHRVLVSPSSSIQARPSVAVLTFKNVSGRPDEAWLSTALSEMLTTELAAGEQLRTVPGENVAQMKINLSLPDADGYGQDTLQKIHKNLNADKVVVGSYFPLGERQIRLDLRLQDAVRGETLAAVSEKGSEDQMDDLVRRAGVELRSKLGVGTVSEAAAAAAKATLPSNSEATRLYSEGLAKLRSFDNVAARDLLQKALSVAPNFALAHSALARAWKELGYDQEAQDEAKKAFDLSAALGRENRLQVEGQYRETTGDWDKAIDTYRSLFTFFPDNVEYGILLVKAQTSGGKGKDAIATANSLRSLPPPSGQDVRIDLVAAEAARSVGDIKQMQSLALSAADRARANEAKLLLARALLLVGSADENLGQTKEATVAEQESAAIYERAGDRNGVAYTIEVQANVLADQGDLGNAIANYKKELAIAREVGNKRAESSALNNLELVLQQQGDLTGVRQMYEQALSVFREIGDRKDSAMTLLNMGQLVQDEGDLAQARKTYEQALSISREVNDKRGEGNGLTNLGTVLDAQGKLVSAKSALDQAIALDLQSGNKTGSADKLVGVGDVLQHLGQLAAAEKTYNDALQVAKDTSDTSNAAWAYVGLGSVALQRADFQTAQSCYQQALAIRNQIGEKQNVEVTRTSMAALAIEEGHAEQVADLRSVRNNLLKENRTPDALSATSLIIKSFLAQGKVEEAQRELEAANSLVLKNQNAALHLELAIDKAVLRMASGNPTAAISVLNEVLSESKRVGFLRYEFEARLALGEVAFKLGRSAQARSDLRTLQVDATNKEFLLIARKAAAVNN